MFSSPEKCVEEFGFLPGQKVADFGSGAGHYALALAKALGRDGLVIALDINEEALARLRNLAEAEGFGRVELLRGDIEESNGSGVKDESLDGVVITNILFQLKSKRSPAVEGYRILKKGGKLCLVEWSDASPISHVASKSAADLVSEDKALRLFTEVGFTLERKFDAGEHHYGMIFKK